MLSQGRASGCAVDTVRPLVHAPSPAVDVRHQPTRKGVNVRKLVCLGVVAVAASIVGSAGAVKPTAGTLASGNGKMLGVVHARHAVSRYSSRGFGALRYHG